MEAGAGRGPCGRTLVSGLVVVTPAWGVRSFLLGGDKVFGGFLQAPVPSPPWTPVGGRHFVVWSRPHHAGVQGLRDTAGSWTASDAATSRPEAVLFLLGDAASAAAGRLPAGIRVGTRPQRRRPGLAFAFCSGPSTF